MPRVALTWVAGWQGGAVAIAAAIGLLRDGILVRQGLEVLVHPDGWIADMRVRAGRGLAAPGHRPLGDAATGTSHDLPRTSRNSWPSTARRSSARWPTAPDAAAPGCGPRWPTQPVPRRRSSPRRSRSAPQDELLAATRRLLDAPGVPWRTRPALRRVGDGGRVLVVHRGSCCLAYRCDAPEEPAEPDALRRAYLERFGDDPPRYCDTCLFRDAADVDTRAAWFAARERRVARRCSEFRTWRVPGALPPGSRRVWRRHPR